MYRALCLLGLFSLYVGLAHSFSWDIVSGVYNQLDFYNYKGELTHTVDSLNNSFKWMTYDPLNNRVLFINNNKSLVSFDVATGKIENLMALLPNLKSFFAYDPVTNLLFVESESHKIYSYFVRPEFMNENDTNLVIDLKDEYIFEFVVDSCGGYIYWINNDELIERVQMNGSERKVIIIFLRTDNIRGRFSLTIDSREQMMYWIEYNAYAANGQNFLLNSADLNGGHRRSIQIITYDYPLLLTVSNDFIYWADNLMDHYLQFPKDLGLGPVAKPKKLKLTTSITGCMAANYAIEDQTQGTPVCTALRHRLPNYTETNSRASLNVSTDGSLLRVNATNVSGESRVSGDTWVVPVCQYYCLQGSCSISADGKPKCRCNASYSGERCEVDACQAYCLNDGVCNLSEQNNPVCRCTKGYQGKRCDVPDSLIKCSQTVSMLKDILNADFTSVTEATGVKSTSPSLSEDEAFAPY